VRGEGKEKKKREIRVFVVGSPRQSYLLPRVEQERGGGERGGRDEQVTKLLYRYLS